MDRRFKNRREAGQRLADQLKKYADREDVIVLGLPRGGVPVGYEVAARLNAPLDVFVVRKLGVPGEEELAMGAIASGGVRVLNQDVIQSLGISEALIERVARREQEELERRERLYRGARQPAQVEGRTVILVDDGLATGASMRAAVKALKALGPKEIVVAVPTAPPEACRELARLVDEIVCLMTPRPFMGVGAWYEEFGQTTDEEVREVLQRAKEAGAGS
jgi:putative phosphoribosyl transferase